MINLKKIENYLNKNPLLVLLFLVIVFFSYFRKSISLKMKPLKLILIPQF